jgi:hypothetical protein
MNSLPFGQLKSFLKILIGVQYKATPQNCGQRPLPLKNKVNPFLTAAQAVCREMAFIK